MIDKTHAETGGVITKGNVEGNIAIGLTFEEHQQALKEAVADKEKTLERAHTAEKQLFQMELDTLRSRALDIKTDYRNKLEELANAKRLLERFSNQISASRKSEAFAALDRGDLNIAKNIFGELSKTSQQRANDADEETAELEFELGMISERQIRWQDAVTHYQKAARLDPRYRTLAKAQNLAHQTGDFIAAKHLGPKFISASIKEFGVDTGEHSRALNDHALLLQATGRLKEAEPLFRRAGKITRKALGKAHPDCARDLTNLASLLQDTGRAGEAEPLLRQAGKINRNALGEAHPDYASTLNTHAELLRTTGRLIEAELLCRQAGAIRRKALGEAHPEYATHLNNLALLLQSTGRMDEAEPLLRQAIAILKKSLGAEHPNTRKFEANLVVLLAEKH